MTIRMDVVLPAAFRCVLRLSIATENWGVFLPTLGYIQPKQPDCNPLRGLTVFLFEGCLGRELNTWENPYAR